MRAKYSNPKRKEYVSRAVSNALCEIMVEEKINQKEMAKRLKWNEPKVCRIIKRYAMPSAEDIYVIADAFKVSADYLIGSLDEDGLLHKSLLTIADELAIYHGIEVYGIRRGWNGLITGDIVKLDQKSVAHTINRGGTILYTARSKEFMTEEGQRRAVSTCKFLGLDSIIAIGGDGTFRGARALSKYGINVIGIPGTIDNDISCTNYCIGFDTAANTAIECIDKLRDTMQSHERCSVVEVMGRNAGYLAMYVGLAVGATAVLVPEETIDFERDVIEKIRQARFNGFTHYMIVVAEGAGSAAEIAYRIKEAIDLDPRVTVLGHIQRGGTPTGRDRVNATKMGYLAVELLLAGKNNRIVCTNKGGFTDIDIDEALSMQKSIQKMEVDVLAAMTGI